MCLISEPVEEVSNTQLFCGLNSNKTKQITIYANDVNNISHNNAMILPVPFPDSVKFHNLESYANFFDDCKSCFYNPNQMLYKSRSLNATFSMNCTDSLEVVDVGSFKVSLAKNLSDLQRVNKNVFTLSNGLSSILGKHYNDHFGFIICKLSKGKEKYHPFAYSHKIFNNKVFLPTKHYHDGQHVSMSDSLLNNNIGANQIVMQTLQNTNLFLQRQNNNNYDDRYADDWDHVVYLHNVDIHSNSEVDQMDQSVFKWNNKVNIKFNKLDFPLDRNCKLFKKAIIRGRHSNIDVILKSA